MIVVGRQADSLAAIHGAPAADRDDGIMTARAERLAPQSDFAVHRIGGNVRKDGRAKPFILKQGLKLTDKGQVTAAAISHDQRIADTKFDAAPPHLGQSSRTIGNRDRKVPVVCGQHRRIICFHCPWVLLRSARRLYGVKGGAITLGRNRG
jgi:hypothetical protein